MNQGPPNMQMGYQMPMPMPQQQMVQQPQPQQPPPQQQQQRQEERLISKAKELLPTLKDKWASTSKEAVLKLQSNNPNATSVYTEGKFESNLEDFLSVCDQIELNLKSAIDCLGQTSSSMRYMPIPPHPSKLEPTPNTNQPQPQQPEFLTYTQYLATCKQQVGHAEEVKRLLAQSAKDVVERNYPPAN